MSKADPTASQRNARYRDSHADKGLIRTESIIPAHKAEELRKITAHWRKEERSHRLIMEAKPTEGGQDA